MKRKILFFIAFAITLVSYKAQVVENWENVNSPTDQNIWSLFFIDDSTGWISGDGGIIYYTENAGDSWIAQSSGTTERLQSIFFINPQKGWAVGKNGKILSTVDGGRRWDSVSIGVTNNLTKVFFIDENTGWISGADGLILKSNDGGVSWSQKETGTTENMTAVEFYNKEIGYATAPHIVLKSTDSGESWSPVHEIGSNEYKDLAVISADTVFTAARNWGSDNSSDLYLTKDGGDTWQLQKTGIFGSSIISLSFKDALNGWGVGNKGKIIVTKDGGESWHIQSSDTNDFYLDTQLLPSGKGYICGTNGKLLTNKIVKSLNVLEPVENIQQLFYPDEEIHFTWNSTGIDKIKLEYSTDNGKSWNLIVENLPAVESIDTNGNYLGDYYWKAPDQPTAFLKFKISSQNDEVTEIIPQDELNPNISYVLASENTKWEKVKLTTDASLNSVYFVNDTKGWICGSDGVILNTIDGGINWNIQETPVNENLSSIIFQDEQSGICFGNNTILVTSNGGDEWRQTRNLNQDDVVIIDFVDHNNGWMVKPFNNNLILYKTSDGGENWRNIFSFNMEQLNSGKVNFINELFGWSWWFEGLDTVYLNKTSDSGAMWNSVQLPKMNKYLDINMYSENFGTLLGRKNETGLKSLYVTEDQGQNWSEAPFYLMPEYVYEDSLLFSTQVMRLRRKVEGKFVEESYRLIQISDNACRNWCLNYSAPLDSSNIINSFFTLDGNILWAAAENGYLYRSGEIVTGLEEITSVPDEFVLKQNYPNPFNPATTISFIIPERSEVLLEVYNLLGEKISTLIDKELNAGEHKVNFDGTGFTSGVYLYRLQSGKYEQTRKFILMK